MSTLDDATWERLDYTHGNWIPGTHVMYGLHWHGDPGIYTHRALVFFDGEEWRMQAWGNMQTPRKGEWIDCGGYKSKLSAMRHARTMAKLFESLRPEEDDDE